MTATRSPLEAAHQNLAPKPQLPEPIIIAARSSDTGTHPMSDNNNETLGALWDRLNSPNRHATPQSTIEAILFAVCARGLNALKEPDNVERLSRCDAAARLQINRRIEKMKV